MSGYEGGWIRFVRAPRASFLTRHSPLVTRYFLHMANPTAHAEGHHHYVAPVSLLVKVLAWLVFFTVLTAVTGTADWIPGWMHVPLAIAIACVKVALVVLIFMGLKHDNRVNSLIFALSTTFVIIFLTFTLFDTLFRGDLSNVDSMTISDRQLRERADSIRAAQYTNLRVAPGDFLVSDSAAVDTAAAAVVTPDTTETSSPAAAPESAQH